MSKPLGVFLVILLRFSLTCSLFVTSRVQRPPVPALRFGFGNSDTQSLNVWLYVENQDFGSEQSSLVSSPTQPQRPQAPASSGSAFPRLTIHPPNTAPKQTQEKPGTTEKNPRSHSSAEREQVKTQNNNRKQDLGTIGKREIELMRAIRNGFTISNPRAFIFGVFNKKETVVAFNARGGKNPECMELLSITVTSIDTLWTCVRLFSSPDCTGQSVAYYPGNEGQVEFLESARSAGSCLPTELDHTTTKYVQKGVLLVQEFTD